MAAQSVAKSPNSAFGAFYRRMKARLGAKQAIVATADKIARAFYHILKHRTPFHDLGGEEYERRAREREDQELAEARRQTGSRRDGDASSPRARREFEGRRGVCAEAISCHSTGLLRSVRRKPCRTSLAMTLLRRDLVSPAANSWQ